MIEFEWDKRKENTNLKKHKVSFKEAQSVFFDENGRLIEDPDHLESEDRFIMLGMSSKPRVVTVVHCFKEDDNKIRIISARKDTKTESKVYWENIK